MGFIINPFRFVTISDPVWQGDTWLYADLGAHYVITPNFGSNPATMTVTTSTGGAGSIKTTNSGSIKLSNQSFANASYADSTLTLKDNGTSDYYGIDYPYSNFVHSTFNGSQINHGQLSSSTSDVFEVEVSGTTINLKLNGSVFRTTTTTSTNFYGYYYKWGAGSSTLPATYTVELTGGLA